MKRQKDMTLKDEPLRSAGVQYATWEKWRNSSRKKEEAKEKQKQSSVVDVFGGKNKVWCCKEQDVNILPKTEETTLCMDITRWSIPKSDWDVLLLQKGYFIWALHYPLWDKCGVQVIVKETDTMDCNLMGG